MTEIPGLQVIKVNFDYNAWDCSSIRRNDIRSQRFLLTRLKFNMAEIMEANKIIHSRQVMNHYEWYVLVTLYSVLLIYLAALW